MMLQQTKYTKSGLTLRNNRLLSKQQKNRRIGARKRCTTAARSVAGKTAETENATKGERPEEWCTSSNAGKVDVADNRNVTISEPGDDRTADDESDGKSNIIWETEQSSTRSRGREEKRPHVSKNTGDQMQVSADAMRFASEVGLR